VASGQLVGVAGVDRERFLSFGEVRLARDGDHARVAREPPPPVVASAGPAVAAAAAAARASRVLLLASTVPR